MIAYIICMNDNMEAVVLNNPAQADELLESKAKEYFDHSRPAYSNYGAYRAQCFWHIHEIEVTEIEVE